VVAVNAAVKVPAAIVTDAGTVSGDALLASVTTAPPAGAACVSVTVQALVEFCPTEMGVQTREEIWFATDNAMLVLAEVLL